MNTISEAWDEVGRLNKAAVGCELVISLTAQAGSYHKLSFHVEQDGGAIFGLGRYEETSGGTFGLNIDFEAPQHFSVGVYPWSYSDIFKKLIGAQDIELGDPEFDRAFVVKSDHTEWSILWLDASLRAAMLRIPRATLELKGQKLSLRFSFSLSDDLPALVARSLEVLHLMGARGRAMSNAWSEIAREMRGIYSNRKECLSVGAKISFELRTVPIEIELIQEWKGSAPMLRTQLRGRKQSVVGSSTIKKEDGDTKAAAPEATLATQHLAEYKIRADSPKKLAALLREHEETLGALKPLNFMSEGELVSMTLRGAILSKETLLSAAGVIAAFCPIVSVDPYR